MSDNFKLKPEEIKKFDFSKRKQLAKDMYFKYVPITSIAEKCFIKHPTVKSWVYGDGKKNVGWKAEREIEKNALLKDLSSDKRGMIQNMANNTLYLLYDFVEKTKEEAMSEGGKIDLKTAEKLTGILERLHKIVQNERDYGDDDIDPNFQKPTTPHELRERIKNADPFASIEDLNNLVDDEDDIILED